MEVATSARAPGPAVATVLGASAIACVGLLALVYAGPRTAFDGGWAEDLPLLNAALNTGSATALVLGRRAVGRGDLVAHRRAMVTAFAVSTVFLVSYVTYHAVVGETAFSGPAPLRAAYLLLLIAHVLASVVALPLVLGTIAAALADRRDLHRRLARVTAPLWLFVSVTGVAVVAALRTVGT